MNQESKTRLLIPFLKIISMKSSFRLIVIVKRDAQLSANAPVKTNTQITSQTNLMAIDHQDMT